MPYKDPERNREYQREYHRKYWKENREQLREPNTIACRKWRHAHLEHRRKYMREYERTWIIDNRERMRELARNRYATDPKVRERCKIKAHKRRCNGDAFTYGDLNTLFEQQEGFCFYCGDLLYSSFDMEIHVDHKTPISRGGTNDLSNLALTCGACNLSKGAKTEEEFLCVKQ